MIKRLKEKPNQNKTKQIETKKTIKMSRVWTLARHFYFSFQMSTLRDNKKTYAIKFTCFSLSFLKEESD